MARKRSIVTGSHSPVKDKRTGQQVVDPERGKKWRITAELPRRGGKRHRKYRDVYGSERIARDEMHYFVTELNQNLTLHTIPGKIDVDISKITFGECVEMWLEANRGNGSLKRLTWESYVVNCLTAAELEDLLSKLQMLYSLRGADDATKNKVKSDINLSLKDVEFLKHHRKEQLLRRKRCRGSCSRIGRNGLVLGLV